MKALICESIKSCDRRQSLNQKHNDTIRAVTTIFILGGQGLNHDFHFLGGLEVTIGGGLTMVEAEELRKFYDFQTSKHSITGHTSG